MAFKAKTLITIIAALALVLSLSLASASRIPAEYDYSPYKTTSAPYFKETSTSSKTTTETKRTSYGYETITKTSSDKTTTEKVYKRDSSKSLSITYNSKPVKKYNYYDYNKPSFYISDSPDFYDARSKASKYSGQISCYRDYYPQECRGHAASSWRYKPVYRYEDYGDDAYGKPYYYEPRYDWHRNFFNFGY
jgi:hypothetical protein